MADPISSAGQQQTGSDPVQTAPVVPEREPTVTPIELPALPESGQEVYDQIMGGINMDLTTAQRETLDEKYKDETPEQKEARLAQYNADMLEYEKQYAAYVQNMNGQIHTFERTARQSIEKDDTTDEQPNMDSLLSSINDL